jgi:hypothetical protein
MDIQKIKDKYYREIYLTKIRIIEKCIKLNDEQKENLEYRIEPRNKAEDEIKENYMGFIGQRLLEGYTQDQSLKMARICVDEAIIQAQKEMFKKKKKK